MRTLVLAVLAILTATSLFAQSSYRIKSGDNLRVEVLEDPSLNRDVLVLPDGRFSFPFAGTVNAGGQTIEQVQSSVASAIASNFATPPNVFVSVKDLRAASRSSSGPATIDVHFLGEVGVPGKKDLPRGTTLLQALAESGGFTKFAAQKRIQLRRTDSRSGKPVAFNFNYKAVANGAELLSDIVLQDGDVILVPERRLFE
ncbi:polysaccharide biosynthesis/export family protein [Aliiroseovarius sp. PTFE2010]|uniref:polysaccharide biosynthesis/export family protein n=1 Tax=Aliiroseovarius sp. PTFE2010 TaxID=3417190 RepID=UPI003CEC5359